MVRVRKIREEIAKARKRGVLIQIDPDTLEQLVDHAVGHAPQRKNNPPLTEDEQDHRRIQHILRTAKRWYSWEEVKRKHGL